MYDIIRIRKPYVKLPTNAIPITILSSIPEELRSAIRIINCNLLLDNNKGPITASPGSLIGYEKSNITASGYSCWVVAKPNADIVEIDGSLYTKAPIEHAMLIPEKNEPKPLWVNNCNLTYNENGTVTLNKNGENYTGRIGIDFLVCNGINKDHHYNASVLMREDSSYGDYLVCNESGKDIGKLCEIYPA